MTEKFKAPTKRQTAVNVVVLKQYSKKLPKNAVRRKMLEDGRIKTVFVSREDNSTSMDAKIKSAFGLKNYTVLEYARKARKLFISPHQDINGSQAIKRRRNLYLCEVSYYKKFMHSMQLCVYTRIKVELTATETQMVMIMHTRYMVSCTYITSMSIKTKVMCNVCDITF